MKAGVIGQIQGDFDNIESFHRTTDQGDVSFTRSLQVTQRDYTESGRKVVIGQAAIQEVEERTVVEINRETGDIEVTDNNRREGKYTDFLIVPGEFMVVGSSKGDFAFDLLQENRPEVHVDRINIDLNEYAEDYYRAEEVDPWQVGFYGNIGQAEKGTVYGEDVFSDDEIGDILERSQLNQLGLRYDMMGHDMKVTMAESGYVEVYTPSNLETADYAEYIAEEIIPYQR